jgi:ABC-type dipeptide/oligopeptide/nickel transport system permease subunit
MSRCGPPKYQQRRKALFSLGKTDSSNEIRSKANHPEAHSHAENWFDSDLVSRQLIAASILFTRSSRTSTVIGIEKEGTGIAAGTLIGVVAQYSSGRRIVVDERSASVMTQIFVPFLRL